MTPRIPCIILVRGGSKRLPRKWDLPWRGTNLLNWCIKQCQACEYTGQVTLASDSQEVLDSAYGVFRELRPKVSDDQTSLEGLRWVQDKLRLQASYVMLCQCTSPFINSADLNRLVLCAKLPCRGVVALGKRGRPSGMGYIIPPFIEDATPKAYVEQDAAEIDIDTRDDYERAVSLCQPS